MISYIAAVLFLLCTPGPAVLSVAGVGAGFGFGAGVRYAVGIVTGTMILMCLVASGLTAAMLAVPGIRYAFLGCSAAYLLFIAYQVAASGSRVGFSDAARAPGFFEGVGLSLINPKGYAVWTTLLSGFPMYPGEPWLQFTVKGLVFVSLSMPVHFVWLYAGASLKRLAPSDNVARAINYAMAIAMIAVVVLAVWTQL